MDSAISGFCFVCAVRCGCGGCALAADFAAPSTPPAALSLHDPGDSSKV
jgi:hypothetical protein